MFKSSFFAKSNRLFAFDGWQPNFSPRGNLTLYEDIGLMRSTNLKDTNIKELKTSFVKTIKNEIKFVNAIDFQINSLFDLFSSPFHDN